ncbi:glycosyltransferase family 2 protein [Segetibacter koreensis]|uniref:glycosyltransferase family 2 protein n=1 Tax=Segetibacter koreensis TaxID=398037 RepID=UPI0003717976|nr:glycosyltransferase [Segetibacter koreensis]
MNERTPKVPPVIVPLPPGIHRPLLSVMVPTFNSFCYLKEALYSVVMQDPGTEMMQIEVIDDCSTDGNVEALVQEIGKGRISYFRQEKNVGSLRNFETCINRAKGHLVHILHSDDRVKEGFYEEVAKLFTTYPKIGAAFTDYSFLDKDSNEITVKNRIDSETGIIENFLFKIAERQLIQPPAIVVKRSVYEELGSFFAVHYGEDWEMWTRIASRFPLAYSSKCVACYRIAQKIGISHQSFLTGQNIKDIIKVINIIQNYLPAGVRAELKKKALLNNSIYSIKVANELLSWNRKAAVNQAKGAFKMYSNLKTFYWFSRFYLMYLLRYKELERFYKSVIK